MTGTADEGSASTVAFEDLVRGMRVVVTTSAMFPGVPGVVESVNRTSVSVRFEGERGDPGVYGPNNTFLEA